MAAPSVSRPTTSVYVGVSVDGFIARPGGEVDFLDAVEPAETDLGWSEFLASVDVLVMGRNTFDMVIESGFDWPYGERLVVVLTSRALEIPSHLAGWVEASRSEPASLLGELAKRGFGRVYVDGGLTVQAFLRAGLVDELIVTTVPTLIGEGIRLFGTLDTDVRLEHVRTEAFGNGMVQTKYRVQT